MAMYILSKLRTLNLFMEPRSQDSEDIAMIHNQILSTRVYIILMITTVSTLILFTVVRPVTISVTESHPSIDTYYQLEAAYPSTLSCQCYQPIVKYKEFYSIEPVFHEVCF